MRRDVFQAVADNTRRQILQLLAEENMTPNSIAEYFNSTRQAVSKHIKILDECNLLGKEKRGREIYYSFNPVKIKEIDQWIEQFRNSWNDRFDQLDKVLVNNNYNKKER